MEIDIIRRIISEIRFKIEREIPNTRLDVENYITIVESLEKQIPKKPIVVSKGEEEYSGCPVCNEFVFDDYCQCCGQAIDWE